MESQPTAFAPTLPREPSLGSCPPARTAASAIRAKLKSALKQTCFTTGLYPVRRRQSAGQIAVFTFHRALSDDTPPEDWRRVLGHPNVSQLRKKFLYIKRNCRIVSVTRAIELLEAGSQLTEDHAVLTIDDGFVDFRSNLLPLLEELDIPASLFVCTGAIEARTVWYQDVYNLIDRVRDDTLYVPWSSSRLAFRDVTHRVWAIERVVLPHLKRQSPGEQDQHINDLYAANKLERRLSDSDRFCTPDDLVALARSPLVELHLHSHAHRPFANLTSDELARDLTICRQFFSERLGIDSRVISYPNGSFAEWQWPVLRAAGITHAFSTAPGTFRPGSGTAGLCLPRVGLGAESMADFGWRVARLLSTGRC